MQSSLLFNPPQILQLIAALVNVMHLADQGICLSTDECVRRYEFPQKTPQ